MIDFRCQACGRQHSVKDEYAGRRGKCLCGNVIVVPEPAIQRHVAVPVPEVVPVIEEVVEAEEVEEVVEVEAVEELVETDEISEVVAVPATDEPLYVYNEEDVNKFFEYCERCEIAHPPFKCPQCGYDQLRGSRTGCMYCNTQYRGSRKNCPICKVEVNLDKARKASKPEKALAYWQAAYNEARVNRYDFHFSDHLAHVYHLVEAGHFDAGWRKLNQLVVHLGERLSSSARDIRAFQKHFDDLSHVEGAMALHNSREARAYLDKHGEDKRSLGVSAVTHAILSLLYYCVSLAYNQQMMPDIYRDIGPDALEKTNIKHLKRVLIDIKKNKKGRPEQLCEVVNRHLPAGPKVDAAAVQQDVKSILDSWA